MLAFPFFKIGKTTRPPDQSLLSLKLIFYSSKLKRPPAHKKNLL
jgi:hypothetical protein